MDTTIGRSCALDYANNMLKLETNKKDHQYYSPAPTRGLRANEEGT
jgi:hypothetical protein